MLNCTIMENGDLLLTANNEARQFIAESQCAGRDFWMIMADLLESYFTNGSFEPFDASYGNPFVGLTSAPCIAESLDTLDDGTREIVGRFWYNADYMFTNELDELKRRGRFVYTLAREEIQTVQNSGGYWYAWRGDMETAGKEMRLAGAYPTRSGAVAALQAMETESAQ